MSMTESVNRQNEERKKDMENQDRKLERVWSGIGWGLFFILIGSLFIADNQGWLQEANGWSYFAIGVGGIFILEFLVRYSGFHHNHGSGLGSLVIGLALVYIGVASIFGFGDWWPLTLVLIGIGYLVESFRTNSLKCEKPSRREVGG
jgi:hypothetical protein